MQRRWVVERRPMVHWRLISIRAGRWTPLMMVLDAASSYTECSVTTCVLQLCSSELPLTGKAQVTVSGKEDLVEIK